MQTFTHTFRVPAPQPIQQHAPAHVHQPFVHLSCAETAKMVRAALRREFPGIKFSVRSKEYSGGASMRVEWTNGPTVKSVEAIIGQYEGASFDGSIDLKSYYRSWLLPDGSVIHGDDQPHQDAQRVHLGADYINCERKLTAEFMRARAAEFAAKYHQPEPPIIEYGQSGNAYIDMPFSSPWRSRLNEIIDDTAA